MGIVSRMSDRSQIDRAWLRCPLAWGLLTLLGACNPQEHHVAPQRALNQVPSVTSTQKIASTPERALLAPLDRATCGLPADLREADWPRRLSDLRSTESQPMEAGSATIAVLPDTQYYVSCRELHFRKQSEWLATQIKSRNIQAALHLGDLTEHNTEEEWLFVREALSPLVEKVPFFVATGNHDYGDEGTANHRHSLFDKYFSDLPAATAPFLAARMTPGSVENAYYRLPFRSGVLGVLVLEWSPRSRSVAWARELLKAYPDDRFIFVTHAYLFHDGSRYDYKEKGETQPWNPRSYGTAKLDPTLPAGSDNEYPEGAYDGQMLWEELLKDQPGLFLTLNGHVLGDGAGVLTSQGSSGNTVHQVLVNYQMLEEGGLGYLRLIEISADGTELRMKTFSPSLGMFSAAADQEFALNIAPPIKS